MSEPIAASVTPPAAASAGLGQFLKRHLRDYGMLLSLVAIMDADKEGYLRSARSLIQTTGRAARLRSGRRGLPC